MMLDTFPHWYYVPENLFGRVQAVTAKAVTHIPERWDEQGCKYAAAADDTAYAIFELQDDVIAQVNSSWAVRVDRGELVEFQVDGTHGSAVAGLFGCCIQTAWRRPCRSGPLTCPRPRLPQPVAPDPDTPSSPTGAGAVGRVEDVDAGRPHAYDLAAGVHGLQASRRSSGVLDPGSSDWDATLAFRAHLSGTGSAWPKPWTPRGATWAWTGRRPSS